MNVPGGMTRWLPLLGLVLLGMAGFEPGRASELKVEVALVWGTNEENPKIKPVDKDTVVKPVDKTTVEKLRKVFVWRNYYEMNRKVAVIPSRSSSRIRMSPECEVEITELQGPKVECRLIGRGQPVVKTEANFVAGEKLCIAGEDKDRTAWFIVLTLLK